MSPRCRTVGEGSVLLRHSVMLSHRFETCGDKKSNHVKGWCGSGQVRSPGDFDSLDAPESRFLSHRLVPQVTDKLAKKKI
jgi:hypothetical protein